MKRKIGEWIKRYGWAEVVSTLFTYLAGWFASLTTGSTLAIAYAGTVGAAAGFYGFIFIRDIYLSFQKHEPNSFRSGSLLIMRSLRNMGFEFGLAELFDFFLIRPFFLYYGPLVLNNYFWGILIGKTLADIFFFAISIFMFEIRKRHFHWF